MRGIGDILDPAPPMDEIPVVLVHPGKPCPTAQIFARYSKSFKEPQTLPKNLEEFDALISFLKRQDNDLLGPACELVPEISNVINSLNGQQGCALARLSGSGATVFGLFEHERDAEQAAKTLAFENPDWWVKSGHINRPERY